MDIVKKDFMEEQKLLYLTRRKQEMAQLQEDLAKNKLDYAKVVSHKLKGHGDTFGYPKISDLGLVIERYVQQGNIEEVKKLANELDQMIVQNLEQLSPSN